MRCCRLLLILLPVALACTGILQVQAQAPAALAGPATPVTQSQEAPPPPPQSPLHYFSKYGMIGVPVTIAQGSDRKPAVIVGKLNEKGFAEGVNHQGQIRYQPVRHFKIVSKPSYGWRFTGVGYNEATNPVLQLQVGHSYIFQVDDVSQYPFLIHKPDPAKPFEKIPYKGFEILNNGSDLQHVRFTPSPDSPDQLAYINLEYTRMKGIIQINKKLAVDNEGEVIYHTVNYRRALVDQYIHLLAQGFIKKPVPLGTDSLDFYTLVLSGFENGVAWYQSLAAHTQPGYSLFLLNQDPAPVLSAYKFTPSFPKPVTIEERRIHRLDAQLQPVESKIYLISIKTGAQDSESLVRHLVRREAQFRPDIQKLLQETTQMKREDPRNPLIKLKLGEARNKIEVNSKHSLDDFKKVGESFIEFLQTFKTLSVTYAIDNESYQAARGLIIQGDYARGLHRLRPIVYPIIKLASIPKSFANHRISSFQDHIEYFLDVLIKAANADETPKNYQVAYAQEAFTILYILPLIEISNKNFIRKALDVIGLLARTGNPDDIQRARLMLTIVPFDKKDEDMVKAFFKVAGDFRSASNFRDALNIYQQFLHLRDSPYYRRACLWSAFCKASSKPPQFGASQLFLEQFLSTYKAQGGSPPRDDSIYSLWRLIEGLLAYKDPQLGLEIAMDKVSEAVVFSRIGYSWVPEILALSAKCYEEKGMPETAKNVYQELKIFFPKHPKTRQFELDFPHLVKK